MLKDFFEKQFIAIRQEMSDIEREQKNSLGDFTNRIKIQAMEKIRKKLHEKN